MTMRRALAVGLGLTLALTAGCDSGSDDDKDNDTEVESTAAGAPCDDLLTAADASATFPADLPVIQGMTVYEKRMQGATAYYFGHVPGEDVVKVRDDARVALESGKGYTGFEADAEPPAEAELAFEGTHEGSVQVIPLCAGHLRVRYKIVK